jgi:hypothetical protein
VNTSRTPKRGRPQLRQSYWWPNGRVIFIIIEVYSCLTNKWAYPWLASPSNEPTLGSSPSNEPTLGLPPSNEPSLGSSPTNKPTLVPTPSNEPTYPWLASPINEPTLGSPPFNVPTLDLLHLLTSLPLAHFTLNPKTPNHKTLKP